MKSALEETCKASFDSFLGTSLAEKTISWEEVPQTEEPPDYFLYINGQKYAVEATTLMGTLDVGTHHSPHAEISASLDRFVDEVETSAHEQAILIGMYAVGFLAPISNFRDVRGDIKSRLLNYIRSTMNEKAASPRIVYEKGYESCEVVKVHNRSSGVETILTFLPRWEGEAAIEICRLLENRVRDKLSKLRDISFPKILLLYDAYRYADVHQFKDCLEQIPSVGQFHSIFVARSTNSGFLLSLTGGSW